MGGGTSSGRLRLPLTGELDRALDDLKTEFPDGITHIGVTNCRRKNNKPGAAWSEHSWSNAADVHVTTSGKAATGDDKRLGDRIAAYMRSRPDLWSEVFWQVAAHYDHVHGTANPRRNPDNKRIPPCAGGPPDPEDEEMEEMIKGIQRNLNKAGFGGIDNKPLTVDGKWGPNTETAHLRMTKAAASPGPKGAKGDKGTAGKPGATAAQVAAEIGKRITNG